MTKQNKTHFAGQASDAFSSFFQALVDEANGATQRRNKFYSAGFELARNTASLLGDVEDTAIPELRAALGATLVNHKAIIAWYTHYLPRCLELVPSGHRRGFANGVSQCHADGKTEF
jgi:hypothetical protein